MGTAFQLEELEDHIGLLTIDVPGQGVNTFGQPVLQELSALLDELEGRDDLRGLLLRSGKKGQFIAGADLNELGALMAATKDQLRSGLAGGHALFTRVSRLPFPTVALIDGNCMGGGTELSLAMDYRIAADNKKTQIGLPEVKVGIIPAWGGTQRLPRVIGLHYAVEMICSGDAASSSKAAKLGLVFDAVPAERLVEEGRRLIEHAQNTGEWKEIRHKKEQPLGLSDDQAFFAFGMAEGFLHGQTKGQYPAPLIALGAIRNGANCTLQEGLQIEQEAALNVLGSPVSAGLIGVFFMQQELARDPGVDNANLKPRDVKRVGVLGAGLMGAGIATAHARSGIPAGMVDIDDDRLADGLKRASKVVSGRIKAGRASHDDLAFMLGHLSTSTSSSIFTDCDVVVEAVTENEELKKKIYGQLSEVLRDDAILGSNTSTISITRMAESAPNPERFVGMHFFLPVDRMQLVEVIRGEKTDDETVATIVALAKRIKKTPIVMKDCPGFLVNRILLPYMNEALVLLLEGASMDQIDKAATRFGMPMGPIALQDMVGLDTSYYAGKVLLAAYSDRAVEMPMLEKMVEAGRLGKKSGMGFRKYTGRKGKPEPDPDLEPLINEYRQGEKEFSNQELEDRLFLPMLLEGTRVLEEEIVRAPSHVDMGMILGTGFPPFRGGLLRWGDTMGAGKVIEKLSNYGELGKRYQPTDLLENMAKSEKRSILRRKHWRKWEPQHETGCSD